MTEQYCSFEVAKMLKEKGFNVPCLAHWFIGTDRNFSISNTPQNWNEIKTNLDWLSCPTHQMAMAWLREKHKVLISIDAYMADHWEGCIDSFEIDIFHGASRIIVPHKIAIHTNYEEAVEAALRYCLENLI